MNNPEQLAGTVPSERWNRYCERRNELLMEYGRTHEHQPIDEVEAVKWQAWRETEEPRYEHHASPLPTLFAVVVACGAFALWVLTVVH